jgi:glutamyl-tRNA synthetase
MARTRFAPSPTGYLHIGGVRTALFNWLFARKQGGQFLLRIDDTDRQRNVEAALAPILHGFRWLGLQWDEGPEVGGPYAPYFQSQRDDKYAKAVETLIARGFAYRDYSRPDEVEAEKAKAVEAKESWVYSRRWMAADDAQAAKFEAEGRSRVVRLKTPQTGVCAFEDLVRGPVEFPWSAEQDIVLQRTDGTVVYHLASVVDDAAYGITHVIRAEEHLANTPRQILIFQGLGLKPPAFAHLPVVAEPGSKTKLSKRKIDKYFKNPDFKGLYDRGARVAGRLGLAVSPETFNPVLTEFYEKIGFLPHALLNYLLLLGWSLDDKTEEFTLDEMVANFSLERVNKSPASFDPAKLLAFQDREMQKLSVADRAAFCLPFLVGAGLVPENTEAGPDSTVYRIVEAAGDRIKIGGDILDYDDLLVADENLVYEADVLEKRLGDGPSRELLEAFADELESVEPFEAPAIEARMRTFLDARGKKIGDLIHPLRAATTGKSKGFGMFETLEILGRERSVSRIRRALLQKA